MAVVAHFGFEDIEGSRGKEEEERTLSWKIVKEIRGLP